MDNENKNILPGSTRADFPALSFIKRSVLLQLIVSIFIQKLLAELCMSIAVI
jgi:hypothetical protein